MARLDDIDPSLALPKPPVDVAATGPADGRGRGEDGRRRQLLGRRRRRAAAQQHRPRRATSARRSGATSTRSHSAATSRSRSTNGDDAAHARRSAGSSSRTRASPASRPSRRRASTWPSTAGTGTRSRRWRRCTARPRGGTALREGGAPGEIEFYPREAGADELIDRFAIAGPPEYCAERLQRDHRRRGQPHLHRHARRRRRPRRVEHRPSGPRGAPAASPVRHSA